MILLYAVQIYWFIVFHLLRILYFKQYVNCIPVFSNVLQCSESQNNMAVFNAADQPSHLVAPICGTLRTTDPMVAFGSDWTLVLRVSSGCSRKVEVPLAMPPVTSVLMICTRGAARNTRTMHAVFDVDVEIVQ